MKARGGRAGFVRGGWWWTCALGWGLIVGGGGRAVAAEVILSDVCVFGATSAGVIAAVQAARMDKSVVLVEPGDHVGGLTAGGLGQTDIGNKAAIGGLAREFYRRVGREYDQPEAWTFEPSMAERVFFQMLNQAKVPVYLQQRLSGVRKEGSRLVELAAEGGKVFRASMFIDASYEGDLMAKAGVAYTVGRESNAQYGETLNGVRASTPKHQFRVDVDPYRKPGDPASGLLPFIQAGDGGVPGSGDRCVQAYNLRLCLTAYPPNRKAVAPPRGYDPAQYELLARYCDALVARGVALKLGDFMHIQMMPHGKTDVNNNGAFSTDFIGRNYPYPEADYATRARIWRAHRDYTQGLLYFLATSPRVPANVRNEMRRWGLCEDEFADTGGWPWQLYVREARRMVSDYVMTERNCRDSTRLPDGIGLAAYGMDSHNCQRIVQDGRVRNEGDVQVGGFPPYAIAYRAIIPKAAECGNLLVPVCLSATHIAYGSIRMEPVFMILGQSAATAAVQAINAQTTVQGVLIGELQARLQADGQILDWAGSGPAAAPSPPARGR